MAAACRSLISFLAPLSIQQEKKKKKRKEIITKTTTTTKEESVSKKGNMSWL